MDKQDFLEWLGLMGIIAVSIFIIIFVIGLSAGFTAYIIDKLFF